MTIAYSEINSTSTYGLIENNKYVHCPLTLMREFLSKKRGIAMEL